MTLTGRIFVVFLVLITLSGCRYARSPVAEPAAATPVATPPEPTVDPIEPGPELPSVTDEERQLVIWAPDFFSRDRENSAGRTVDAALTQFEQRHPNVRIELQPKALSGEAGAFIYLQSAQRVAPDILPDLVLLRGDELWQAVDLGLVTPLTGDEQRLLAEVFPFAQQAVLYGGQPWGIPYITELVHAAYQMDAVAAPPETWAELLTSGYSYLFPAGSRDGYANESVLLQYLGAGGQLTEDGTLSNSDALEAVFAFYQDGVAQQIFPQEIEQYAGLPSVWTDFIDRRADMADVTTTSALLAGDAAANVDFSAVPTLSGESVTLANTWAFAILTDEPEQRALSLDLVSRLFEPSVHGAWSLLVHRVPTQAAAFAEWPSSNEYYALVQNVLIPAAASQPNGRLFEEFLLRLQDALRGVLNGSLTPAEAAAQVEAGP